MAVQALAQGLPGAGGERARALPVCGGASATPAQAAQAGEEAVHATGGGRQRRGVILLG